MKKIWVYKTDSFREAEEADASYYLKMSKRKRLEIVQFLREAYYKMKKTFKNNESRKRLRRIIKIIQ